MRGDVERQDAMFFLPVADTGRPTIALEKLLQAVPMQALYNVRSERMLIAAVGLQPAGPVVRGAELRNQGGQPAATSSTAAVNF
jgi:hypothetical protein